MATNEHYEPGESPIADLFWVTIAIAIMVGAAVLA